ncbi:hypothetical protein tinsulaeT_01690 [Thalassotalea insulae]|uniref:STAS domain-containing protein n=1 Tax=Thalassotalea insulae TaxID=2056778 RepID=A0ABQ6GMJ8_9GAMM|nr:STAS domain-containing protein [Thalassotalea insulae]GLX76829.1 hypothetical protein tinsulaeT_01690 [Thalassotalea insulae]
MFILPTELTIANVDEYQSLFLEFVASHNDITLDTSRVSLIDTVGIQLLLTMVSHVVTQKKTLIWQNQSSIIEQSIRALGIDEPILAPYFNS